MAEEKAMLTARLYLEQGQYPLVIESLQGVSAPQALAWKGYSYVKLDSTARALSLLEQVPADDPLYSTTGKLVKLIKEPYPYRKKSYAAAGLLSLIPGAGHIYTGRTGDAVYTMLLVGIFGGLTYFYHDNGSSTRAIAAGTFCGLFYSGSIYGALVGVRLFNRAEKAKFQKQADEIFRSNH